MKIRLLSVGKDKGPTAELAQEYAERIRRFADLELVEVRAGDPRDQRRVVLHLDDLERQVPRDALAILLAPLARPLVAQLAHRQDDELQKPLPVENRGPAIKPPPREHRSDIPSSLLPVPCSPVPPDEGAGAGG